MLKGLSLFLLSVIGAFAANPDCRYHYQFNYTQLIAGQTTTVPFNNQNASCGVMTTWSLSYSTISVGSIALQVEQAATTAVQGNSPGSFSLVPGVSLSGTNPSNTLSGIYSFQGFYPWIRINVTSISGISSSSLVDIYLNGWSDPSALGSVSTTGSSGGAVNSVTGAGTVTCTPTTGSVVCTGTGGGGTGGNVILATDPSLGWVCDGTTVNSNTVIAATNAWGLANDGGTIVFPKNSTCLRVGQTTTASINTDAMSLGWGTINLIGDNTQIINTTESSTNNINFQSGNSSFTCISGPVATPTVNYDYSAALISTVSAGSSTVTAITPSSVATYNIGDTVLVYGGDIYETAGGGGFPPSYHNFEFKTITGINYSTGVVTLSSKLMYGYNSLSYYVTAQHTTAAAIRDISLSTCPGGGAVKRAHHIYVQGIDFSHVITAQASTQTAVVYAGGADYVEFNNCKFDYFSPSDAGTIVVRNSSFNWIELDKLVSHFFVYNSVVNGNRLLPNADVVTSGAGVLDAIFDHTVFKGRFAAAPRNVMLSDDTFYGVAASPYGFFSNGAMGYQQSMTVIRPRLYANGVTEGGITGVGNGYNIQVNVASTNSFNVAAGANTYALAQYAGPGVQVFDHASGALLGTITSDYPTLVGGLLTVSTTFTPTNGQQIDLNSNPVNYTIDKPISIDPSWTVNDVPPGFSAGLTAQVANLSFNFGGMTTVSQLNTCTNASTGATKWVKDASSQYLLGSGGGTVPTQVYCSGSTYITGTWLPIAGTGTTVTAGTSGAICVGAGCSPAQPVNQVDIVTSVVDLLASDQTLSGKKSFSQPIILGTYTVATLPACTGFAQAIATVTDASAPTYNGTLTGSGTVKIPVFCNGATWSAH